MRYEVFATSYANKIANNGSEVTDLFIDSSHLHFLSLRECLSEKPDQAPDSPVSISSPIKAGDVQLQRRANDYNPLVRIDSKGGLKMGFAGGSECLTLTRRHFVRFGLHKFISSNLPIRLAALFFSFSIYYIFVYVCMYIYMPSLYWLYFTA